MRSHFSGRRGDRFLLSNPITRLMDGSTVRTWKNPVGVDHVFIAHRNNNMIYGGFVGWIHSQGLNSAINSARWSFLQVLTPERYVGAEEVEDDDEAFEEKMLHLTKKLEQQFEDSARLEAIIKENLRGLGYGN
jgi:hypothetical protein